MFVRRLALVSSLLVAACGSGRTGAHGSNGTNPDGTAQSGSNDPNVDSDHDGVTPAQGDCDDSSPLIGPNAVEVANNGRDDDCDGQVDNVVACDTSAAGMKTAEALTHAIGICDKRFVTSATFEGPSDPAARNVVPAFGVVKALEGANMAFLSTGEATTSSSYDPEPGTGLGGFSGSNEHDNPVVTLKLPAGSGCGSSTPPAMVQDYTELKLQLVVPWNANSFSFQSQFFSAEYPEFVCKDFNDRFLVIMDDGSNPPQQIAFDAGMNTISVDNGFFTICKNSNDHPPQTQHCTKPTSEIAGTGYDSTGGSTGWLTTSAPVVPGDHITLRFIIFDEGDDIYDSSVLIDNFKWMTDAVAGPVTVQ